MMHPTKITFWLIILISFNAESSVTNESFHKRPCTGFNDYGSKCITQKQFNSIIDNIINEYKEIFKQHGWILGARKRWKSNTESASYEFETSTKVNLVIHGGVAKAMEMTVDALAVVTCHELGHLYALIDRQHIPGEGGADYFAILSKCTLKALDNVRQSRKVLLPKEVISSCTRSRIYLSKECERVNRASYSASQTRARVLGHRSVSFLTPDPTVVTETSYDLTSSQCGLDTFLAASLGRFPPRCWFYSP
jgi:hypothetical protein